MHKMNFALAAGAALLLTGTATAERQRDPNQTICRSERSSSSRIAARSVCRTREEWRIINETRRRDADRLTERSERTPPMTSTRPR